MKTMSSWQFTIFRIIFGCYLTIHFTMLIPYANELFGSQGLIGDPTLNPTAGIFPNPLNFPLPEWAVTGFIVLMVIFSMMFASGFLRPVLSILLWFGWTALFHRNNLIGNPSISYIGLLLMLSALIPSGEPMAFSRKNPDWYLPKWVFRCAWILLATGYSFSGFTKLFSPSWIDGSAMKYLLLNPLARPGPVREMMLTAPDFFLSGLTWFTLAAELMFLPLAIWKKSRPWIWLTLVLMHLGIIAVVDFADLSMGMLMIHLFTFDPTWLNPVVKPGQNAVLAYDGECMMCSKLIRFVAEEDRLNQVKFVALQSERGLTMEAAVGGSELSTVLFETKGHILSRSTAIISLLSTLGGHWRLLAMMMNIVPRSFRDRGYRFIAARRYRWFGQTKICEIPSAAVRNRLM